MKVQNRGVGAWLFVVLALPGVWPAALSGQETLDEPVTLTGLLRTMSYYGPPTWGRNPQTDEVWTALVLELSSPLCSQAPGAGVLDRSACGLLRVQVIPSPHDPAMVGADRPISIRGVLMTAHTDHHRTPVVVDADSMRWLTRGRHLPE
jgi:hypothetical protein